MPLQAISGGSCSICRRGTCSRGKKNKSTGKTSSKDSEKCTKECSMPVEDLTESSVTKSKKTKVAAPKTKQVAAREDGEGGTLSISATLDNK